MKSGSLPAKADTEKQSTYFNKVLYPLMEQAKARSGKIGLLFLDGSHFVMGNDYLGYIYGVARRFVKTYSGRKRYNVLGALNFVTKKVTTVSNDAYINSTEVCNLLKKIAVEYAGQAIYLVLDNAKYQKCKLVQDLADQLGIVLMYIPPYSPNLNLIERIWKFVKKGLRTKYYDNFDVFKKKIDSLVSSTDKENKSIIDNLIGEKVQLFDDLVAINQNTFVSNKTKGNVAA